MNYDVEQAISRKADNWKLCSLESEVHNLRNDNKDLSRQLDILENKISNYYTAIDRLISLTVEMLPQYDNGYKASEEAKEEEAVELLNKAANLIPLLVQVSFEHAKKAREWMSEYTEYKTQKQ